MYLIDPRIITDPLGPQIFGAKFLEAIDSVLTMSKRATKVADSLKPRQSQMHSFRGGRSSFFSDQRGFRSRIGGRTCFPLSRYIGGFRSATTRQSTPSKSTK